MATITSPRSESPAISLPQIRSPSLASANGTPSSSVRPSIDLSTNGPLSPAAPQQNVGTAPVATQRRNRAALRDYYNLKAKAPAGVHPDQGMSRTASIASNASDSTITSSAPLPDSSSLTAELDDPSFDADAYVSEMLKTAGLRDILRTESALVSEIRNLDGERKALVYDNYSKLIKAVGTIAEMQKGMHKKEEENRLGIALGGRQKEQTPGLDGVEKLGEKFDGLLKVVKDLRPGEADDGKKLLEAREKRKQKETVKWALDAPSRLQRMIDQGLRDEAARDYQSVTELLDKWTGVAGVDELRSKCAEIMESANKDAEEPKSDDSG